MYIPFLIGSFVKLCGVLYEYKKNFSVSVVIS